MIKKKKKNDGVRFQRHISIRYQNCDIANTSVRPVYSTRVYFGRLTTKILFGQFFFYCSEIFTPTFLPLTPPFLIGVSRTTQNTGISILYTCVIRDKSIKKNNNNNNHYIFIP